MTVKKKNQSLSDMMLTKTLKHHYYQARGVRRLKNFGIKPTYRCTANCLFCEYRRDLAATIFKKQDKVNLEHWLAVISEASKLGALNLAISGGEPLLYKDLALLIRHGKKSGMRVGVNSNGSLFTQEKADLLAQAGLDHVMISLDSCEPEVHDNVRRFKGLWNKAVKSIGFLKAANIDVAVHTIISRHQYLNIGRLIQLCIEWGVSSLYICHVEADHENRHMLMSVEQIKEYSKDVLPGLIDLISSSGSIPDPNKPVIIEGLSTLFPSDDLEIEMYSQGRYGKYSGKSKNSDCLIPYYYSLILEDGSVLPCNAVEYTHDPKVGNILEDDFNKIWHSKAFNDFRKKRMEWCAVCPMMAHRIVPLTKLTNRSSDIFKQDAREVR